MPSKRSAGCGIDSASLTSSDSVRKPCAIVTPHGDSSAASFGIDVDELVILGDVGERVDALLRDLEPVAGALGLADRCLEKLVGVLAPWSFDVPSRFAAILSDPDFVARGSLRCPGWGSNPQALTGGGF